MDRDRAVVVLKDISNSCPEIGIANIMLMPPDADDTVAKGNQLHISITLDESTKQCLEATIKKYNLEIKEGDNKTIIYEPIDYR